MKKIAGDKKNIRNLVNNYLIIIGILILVIYTAIVRSEFRSGENVINMIRQLCPLGMVALGMTIVIIGGYIDLSVAGMFSMIGIVTTSMLNVTSVPVAVIVGLLTGVAGGALNGAILNCCGARDDADALFITYGMSTVYGALALLISNGTTINVPTNSSFLVLGKGSIGAIPIAILIFFAGVVILQFIMKKTILGRKVHLSGGNPVAARLNGVSISKSVMFMYIMTGLMTAIGAIILISRVTSASPVLGKNYETNAIMSVVIGGTTLKGGHGSIVNTVFGVMLITIMANALNMLGVSANAQSAAKGLILVAAIWLDSRKQR